MARAEAGEYQDWIDELAAEFPDEEWLQAERLVVDDDFEERPWHGMYFRAFDALMYDRFYGAFGGETPISYISLSQYARDHGISDGDDLWLFHVFMNALDAEHLKMRAEAAEAKKKEEQNPAD